MPIRTSFTEEEIKSGQFSLDPYHFSMFFITVSFTFTVDFVLLINVKAFKLKVTNFQYF
jgi:hypothetical protein